MSELVIAGLTPRRLLAYEVEDAAGDAWVLFVAACDACAGSGVGYAGGPCECGRSGEVEHDVVLARGDASLERWARGYRGRDAAQRAMAEQILAALTHASTRCAA